MVITMRVERGVQGFARVDVKDVEAYETYVRETQASWRCQYGGKRSVPACCYNKNSGIIPGFYQQERILQLLQDEYYPAVALQESPLPEGGLNSR